MRRIPESILFLLVLVVLAALPAGCSSAGSETGSGEIEAIRQAANRYFDAEKRGDLQTVYNTIAPSGDFRKGYTFENYKDIVSQGGPTLKSYRIENIDGLSTEVDRKAHPDIEMLADVTVYVELFDPATGETRDRTCIFVFVKEKGLWYKG